VARVSTLIVVTEGQTGSVVRKRISVANGCPFSTGILALKHCVMGHVEKSH